MTERPLFKSDDCGVERRWSGRTTISRDAKLFFNPQSGVLPCGVRNITNRGASLRVADLTILPVNFELSFDNFHTKRDCRLVWRDGDFLGVAFQN